VVSLDPNEPEQANALTPNWGQIIFQSANEINANVVLRKSVDDIQAKVDDEKKWWDTKRAAIQSDFMKELDDEATKPAASKAPSEDDAVLVDANTPSSTPSGKKKKGKK